MAVYQLIKTQKLPVTTEELWDFISSPKNLSEITPGHFGFVVTRNSGEGKMYPGMIITYKVRPVLGIQLNWMTEITHVKELEYFVDEQRIGPFSMWHHQHKLEPIEGGVLMTDIVSYRPPLGFIGALANSILIKRQLEQVFAYRSSALEKRYGKFG
jgi:ligand-binding SRPBCC domain-containing protein